MAAAAEAEAQALLEAGRGSSGGAYVLGLSSGELRQLMASSPTEIRLLDTRIQESRLPQLPSGRVLAMHLADTFLVVVQEQAVHMLPRPAPGHLRPPRSFQRFAQRAISAGIVRIDDEPCLCVLLSDLAVHLLALPGLQPFLTLGTSGDRTTALTALQAGGQSLGGCLCEDGYLVAHGDGGLWSVSCLASSSTLDEAGLVIPAMQLAEAVLAATPPARMNAAPTAGASDGSGYRKTSGGILKSLFGSGAAQPPRPLRECVTPGAATPLPGDVDAARIDQSKGLPPAWRDPNARPPPPPAAASRTTSSASAISGTRRELEQANLRAQERGEKLGELSHKAQQLNDDSANFLKLAKELNAKQQSRWF
eukprot:gnl/TRDRNA2_/TRDRNA2_82702_c0_seq1.p1 gnl/TRDRNA2_/TRDRNA2_82702_c0~~gnl/TRDRNA2_/TRDRNA2_82702_c0_seq1.p1  ORF type:complete len:403 (+),score=78.69 gnl/TRDRNA2_/TRDRNA2_82702_c0_seq1:115-1209(+)